MKLFVDTANIDNIRSINELGFVCGVTTNPTLIAKECSKGQSMSEILGEIASIVDGPISAEVMGTTTAKMVEEAIELFAINKNIVIKLPMCAEGLKAATKLKKKNIPTNVTLIFTPTQALIAARAGATYVSPFLGRLDDVGSDGIELIKKTAKIFALHNIDAQIIAAAIRTSAQVTACAEAGADIATVPYDVLCACIDHPLTTIGIEKFLQDSKNIVAL